MSVMRVPCRIRGMATSHSLRRVSCFHIHGTIALLLVLIGYWHKKVDPIGSAWLALSPLNMLQVSFGRSAAKNFPDPGSHMCQDDSRSTS